MKACEVAEGDGEEPERADVERGCGISCRRQRGRMPTIAGGVVWDYVRMVGTESEEKHGCEVLRFREGFCTNEK